MQSFVSLLDVGTCQFAVRFTIPAETAGDITADEITRTECGYVVKIPTSIFVKIALEKSLYTKVRK
jgi:hypothetical protein